MSMFDTFLASLNQTGNSLTTQMLKFRNRGTMRAVVYGCALIAAADGKVDSAEKQKMIGFMKQNEAMKVFDTNEVIKVFNEAIDKFDFDKEIGKGEALNEIVRLKANPEAGQLLIRLCIAIGGADGNFDPEEKAVVREMCGVLGLAASGFGL